MNGYVGFYKNRRFEVYANTTYEAQQKIAKLAKAKHSYDVAVMLAEKDGKQVTHLPLFNPISKSKRSLEFKRALEKMSLKELKRYVEIYLPFRDVNDHTKSELVNALSKKRGSDSMYHKFFSFDNPLNKGGDNPMKKALKDYTLVYSNGDKQFMVAKSKSDVMARFHNLNKKMGPYSGSFAEVHETTEKERNDYPMIFRKYAKTVGSWAGQTRRGKARVRRLVGGGLAYTNPFSVKKTIKKAGQQAKTLAPLLMVGGSILLLWQFLKNK